MALLMTNNFCLREGYSTTDAILEFVDSCSISLNDKIYTIAANLDSSKVFDTVNKDIMLK